MSNVKDTIRELIEFSEKQQAAQRRKLAAEGKSQSNAWVDAFSNIIKNLTSILGEDAKEADAESEQD